MSKKKPTLRLKHPGYQPSAAELRKDTRISMPTSCGVWGTACEAICARLQVVLEKRGKDPSFPPESKVAIQSKMTLTDCRKSFSNRMEGAGEGLDSFARRGVWAIVDVFRRGNS